MSKLEAVSFRLKDGRESVVRSYAHGDEALAQEFSNAVAKESHYTLKYEGMPLLDPAQIAQRWIETDQHPFTLNLGAFCDGKLAGNIRLYQLNSSHPWIRHIASFGMAVRAEFWRKGVGTLLLQTAEAHAIRCGIRRIEAEVRVANEAGLALYRKNGFEVEGTRRRAALIDGVFHDEYYISKMLS
jgi:RimJ/RimL family protein N-acetyltransferase